jgi:hypothetical protein
VHACVVSVSLFLFSSFFPSFLFFLSSSQGIVHHIARGKEKKKKKQRAEIAWTFVFVFIYFGGEFTPAKFRLNKQVSEILENLINWLILAVKLVLIRVIER